jgi:hypothetical protein
MTENTITTMEPPKLGVSCQTYRQPQSNVRELVQPQEREQQPPHPQEVVNMEEIPSSDMKPGSPTPIVEETQWKTPVGMDIDVPEGGPSPQVENVGNHSQPENPEEYLRTNGMVLNQKEMICTMKFTHNHTRTNHRRAQWNISHVEQRSMQKIEQGRLGPRVSHQNGGKKTIARSPRKQASQP